MMMVHVLQENTSVMVLKILVMMLNGLLIVQIILMKFLKFVVPLPIYTILTFIVKNSVLEVLRDVLLINLCVLMDNVFNNYSFVMVHLIMKMLNGHLTVMMVLMKS